MPSPQHSFIAVLIGLMTSTISCQEQPDLDDEEISMGGFGALPGHVIYGKDFKPEHGRNIFLSDWFVIGPIAQAPVTKHGILGNQDFDSIGQPTLPDKESLRRRPRIFAADTDRINLDTTIWSRSKPRQWSFFSSKTPRIRPSRIQQGSGIYYAWCQVHADSGKRYWVSMGTEAYGSLWINGKLIWHSDRTRKRYRADEHTEEFALRPGPNSILVRCLGSSEKMSWSTIIHAARPKSKRPVFAIHLTASDNEISYTWQERIPGKKTARQNIDRNDILSQVQRRLPAGSSKSIQPIFEIHTAPQLHFGAIKDLLIDLLATKASIRIGSTGPWMQKNIPDSALLITIDGKAQKPLLRTMSVKGTSVTDIIDHGTRRDPIRKILADTKQAVLLEVSPDIPCGYLRQIAYLAQTSGHQTITIVAKQSKQAQRRFWSKHLPSTLPAPQELHALMDEHLRLAEATHTSLQSKQRHFHKLFAKEKRIQEYETITALIAKRTQDITNETSAQGLSLKFSKLNEAYAQGNLIRAAALACRKVLSDKVPVQAAVVDVIWSQPLLSSELQSIDRLSSSDKQVDRTSNASSAQTIRYLLDDFRQIKAWHDTLK